MTKLYFYSSIVLHYYSLVCIGFVVIASIVLFAVAIWLFKEVLLSVAETYESVLIKYFSYAFTTIIYIIYGISLFNITYKILF